MTTPPMPLNEAYKELQQFVHIASHDLQEPLYTITNYIDLILLKQKDKFDDEGIEFLNYVQEGALKAQHLIQNLLEYTNITTRDYPLEWTDSKMVLETTLSSLRTPIEEKSATVTYDSLPELKINASQIAQLFKTLISNAIQYARKDVSPAIHISARRENQSWIFAVQDNGSPHSKNEHAGTRISLATCKKIVQHHGGEIWAEPEPEKDSCFYFSLPVTERGIENAS